MNWDILIFLKAWIRSPRTVGAVIPSSPVLASAMADQVVPEAGKTVVELGAGTGSVTHALLKRGVQPQDLVVIETDPVFCKKLRLRFPDIRILNVDAVRLEQVFKRYQISNVDTIVSSLPLLSLERRPQQAILEQCFQILGQGGKFIQYTYGVGSPIQSAMSCRTSPRGNTPRPSGTGSTPSPSGNGRTSARSTIAQRGPSIENDRSR